MKIKIAITFLLIIGVLVAGYFSKNNKSAFLKTQSPIIPNITSPHPLSIEAMRKKSYPGSDLVIESDLGVVSNYHKYIVSYLSDGLKINALLTVPVGKKPAGGWPVIIFNHGYIAPATYLTDPTSGQYATYYSHMSEAGYIVLKPDYRGNGNSQGQPEGAYYSPAYATDVLNAVSSIKKYSEANPAKIGMWGHSMGGNITLRDIVINAKDIKAAVIWGGVVGSYSQLADWRDPFYRPSVYELSLRYKYRAKLYEEHGTPQSNPTFWNSLDPTNFLGDIKTPVQLHHGTADEEVPLSFASSLNSKLKAEGKNVEYFEYLDDNHNISGNFNIAMQRSIDFFDQILK